MMAESLVDSWADLRADCLAELKVAWMAGCLVDKLAVDLVVL